MKPPGWYPDPSGAFGMYRYWDGATWSEATSPTPLPGPPSAFAGTQPIRTGSGAWGASPAPAGAWGASPAPSGAYDNPGGQPEWPGGDLKPKRSPVPWIVLGVGLVAIAVVVFLVIRWIGGIGPGPGPDAGGAGDPPSTDTTKVCPDPPKSNVRADHPSDGRVYGGKLSYPMLGGDWSPVETEEIRIPFARDVAGQMISIHPGWMIAVYVGELNAGDGFYSPEEGSKIVNKCIFSSFYGGAKVNAETLRSEAFTLDGCDGWITQTNLSFNIPGVPTTSELTTVIILQTSGMSSSIFFSALSNDAQEYKPDMDAAMAGLHVVT